MSARSHRRGPPRRRVTSRALKRDLLVYTEGARTEEDYVKHWARAHREKVNVIVAEEHGQTPLQLVQLAVGAKEAAARDERRGRGKAYDEVWCVFDVDDHPNLADAQQLAAARGINLAISNPCIELWFVLHFHDQTAEIERHPVQADAEALLGCGKRLTPSALETLEQRYPEAKSRAAALDAMHERNGSPQGHNPSSGVCRLVDSIALTDSDSAAR